MTVGASWFFSHKKTPVLPSHLHRMDSDLGIPSLTLRDNLEQRAIAAGAEIEPLTVVKSIDDHCVPNSVSDIARGNFVLPRRGVDLKHYCNTNLLRHESNFEAGHSDRAGAADQGEDAGDVALRLGVGR